MKKWIPWTALALLALGAGALVSAQGAKPEKKVITGEVIDVASYAMRGARGEEHAEAGAFRAEGGFPVGILEDETEEIYIAVYRNPAPASALESANKILTPLMGKSVVVQGNIYRVKNLNLVQISIVSEM